MGDNLKDKLIDVLQWLKDEVKEIEKVIQDNEVLEVEQLEEIQVNLNNIEQIQKEFNQVIEKELN